MSKAAYERGKTLIYPSIYPILTFTPIFGHRGDFVWIEKVMAAWPEHDSEFTFVRSTMHDESVDRLKAENAKLRDLIADMSKAFFTLDIDHCQACPRDKASRCQMFATTDWECAFVTEMRKLGIEATK